MVLHLSLVSKQKRGIPETMPEMPRND